MTHLGFEASGTSADQLVINGIVYSSEGDIKLSRGYIDESVNNTNPAVLVNYRPDLMFNMPPTVVGALSNWREGR